MIEPARQELRGARLRVSGRLPALQTQGMTRRDASAVRDVRIDMDLDEATVAGIIEQVLVGRWPRERPIQLVAEVDARLAGLAEHYPANDSLRELIARRQELRSAVERLVAAAGLTVEEFDAHPGITERWFCLAGDPPDVEAILGVMRSRAIEAQLNPQFAPVNQEAPWHRIVIDVAEKEWIWLEVHRSDALSGFRGQIRDVITTVPVSARPQLRRQLGETRFIIGAYPATGIAGRTAIAALREYLVRHHQAVVWADGEFVEGLDGVASSATGSAEPQ